MLTDSEREIASNKAHKDLTTATELMCKVRYVSSSDIYLVVCGLLTNSLGTKTASFCNGNWSTYERR